jgi:hypothetical protein
MGVVRPKQFFAVRDFTLGRRTFRAGDPIEHGLTLQRLLRFGGKFAAATKTSTPVESTATPVRGEASESPRKD